MVHAFTIQPETYNTFEDEDELLDQCKEWGLISEKAVKTKAFFYKGSGMNMPCSIIGYVDQMTAVIEFDNKQLHCIHPSYLKEMQAANYSQRLVAGAEDTAGAEPEAQQEDAKASTGAAESIEAVEAVEEVEAKAPKAKQPKEKAKKERTPKLELPEEKVKMIATVQEFTTVPNNFSDNDDEVIIYEGVSILEPSPLDIGTAWSSHSNTLKKLELEVGDTVTFECKIVAKKLSKHPVPYKINNPAKMQKAAAE